MKDGRRSPRLALAHVIMDAKLNVRLDVFLAVVENAVSSNAFRPGDIIPSRKGLTVEIDNTDAEGRLVLADAITRACEDNPALLLDFATLTGAARTALGPDKVATGVFGADMRVDLVNDGPFTVVLDIGS